MTNADFMNLLSSYPADAEVQIFDPHNNRYLPAYPFLQKIDNTITVTEL